MAVHAMALLGMFPEKLHSSEEIAGSIGTNPVIVRRILAALARAGLVENRTGKSGGSRLLVPPEELDLLSVYETFQETPFRMHQHPNKRCPCGSGIEPALSGLFGKMETAMRNELDGLTLDRVIADITKERQGRSQKSR